MDNQAIIRTGLSDAKPVTGGHTLLETPLNGKINLRGNPENTAFTQGVESVLGAALPLAANTVTSSADLDIFWLSLMDFSRLDWGKKSFNSRKKMISISNPVMFPDWFDI